MMEEKQTETSQFKEEKLFFQLTQNILAKKKKKVYFNIIWNTKTFQNGITE